MAVPKDSYLLFTIISVGVTVYYLCSRSLPNPPMGAGIHMMDMHQHREVDEGPPLDGMEILRNPKTGPIIDHNIKGPIYNFDVPGLTEGWITLSDGKRVYRIGVHPLKQFEGVRPPVLLLHASQYNPYAWVETGLLFKLRDNGFHAVAVDIPGYHIAKNLPKLTTDSEYLSFLTDIIKWEKIEKCVVVAPEMSSDYVLPLIKSKPNLISSLILVSPPFEFNVTEVLKSKVKTLLMTGEFEHFEMKRYTSPNLEHIVIPLSANFYFVENSVQFNKLILDYLNRLIEPEKSIDSNELNDL